MSTKPVRGTALQENKREFRVRRERTRDGCCLLVNGLLPLPRLWACSELGQFGWSSEKGRSEFTMHSAQPLEIVWQKKIVETVRY